MGSQLFGGPHGALFNLQADSKLRAREFAHWMAQSEASGRKRIWRRHDDDDDVVSHARVSVTDLMINLRDVFLCAPESLTSRRGRTLMAKQWPRRLLRRAGGGWLLMVIIVVAARAPVRPSVCLFVSLGVGLSLSLLCKPLTEADKRALKFYAARCGRARASERV